MVQKRRIFSLLLALVLVTQLAVSLMPVQKAAAMPAGWDIEWMNGAMKLTLPAGSYNIMRGGSRLDADYVPVASNVSGTWIDNAPRPVKYENWYKITPAGGGKTQIISLENKMFGDDALIYDAKYDSSAGVLAEINDAHDEGINGYAPTFDAQFGTMRYAMMFKPGDYRWGENVAKIGFYTGVYGLGKLPTETKVSTIHTPAHLPDNNATCTFWRSIENIQVNQQNGDPWFEFKWAVAQAAPARRLDVIGNASFDWFNGWNSGGYIADSRFSGNAGSWSQQQFYIRNSSLANGFFGVTMNNMIQGSVGNIPADRSQTASGGTYVTIPNTPVIREKPFLYFDNGEYKVFRPALRSQASGLSWSDSNMGPGTSYDISDFYVARADQDSAASINAALDSGKHLLLSPGIYFLDEPIHVKRADTIVLGMGYATLVPKQSNDYGALFIEDVDGVSVAGLMFDAHYSSKYLLRVGDENSDKDHADNPTFLYDTITRVGGFRPENVNVDVAVQINSDDVVGDHFWVWRADHGAGTGWFNNTSDYGLIVAGDDVYTYGLFNEHYQKYTTLWLGERGRTYFYQNEIPYDPTNQNDYKSHGGTVDGYAQYKIADNVQEHYAVGLGIYEVFINTNGAGVFVENAVECPNTPGVRIESLYTNSFSVVNGAPSVGIKHAINGTGISVGTGPWIPNQGWSTYPYLSYVNGVGRYVDRDGSVKTVNGTPPPSDLAEILADIPGEPSVPNPSDPVDPGDDVDGVNLAAGKAAAASSEENYGTLAAFAVDGDTATRWSSLSTDQEWFSVDLGKNYDINRVVFHWETARAEQYKVQISTDGSNWTDVKTVDCQGGIETVNFETVSARYVKMLGISRTTNYGYSFYEMEVYGNRSEETDPIDEPVKLLSQDKPAIASSEENGATAAANVTDGDILSRWSSVHSADQWIYVDLEQAYDVSKVVFHWEAAYASEYKLQVSDDAVSWTDVKTVNSNGGTETVSFDPIKARFVKMQGINRATLYGYSIFEMEVYGK